MLMQHRYVFNIIFAMKGAVRVLNKKKNILLLSSMVRFQEVFIEVLKETEIFSLKK